jgi:hypothetical protein
MSERAVRDYSRFGFGGVIFLFIWLVWGWFCGIVRIESLWDFGARPFFGAAFLFGWERAGCESGIAYEKLRDEDQAPQVAG